LEGKNLRGGKVVSFYGLFCIFDSEDYMLN
jgi:hypothetical protein